MDGRFDDVDKRFDGLDKRFDAMDGRFDELEKMVLRAIDVAKGRI